MQRVRANADLQTIRRRSFNSLYQAVRRVRFTVAQLRIAGYLEQDQNVPVAHFRRLQRHGGLSKRPAETAWALPWCRAVKVLASCPGGSVRKAAVVYLHVPVPVEPAVLHEQDSRAQQSEPPHTLGQVPLCTVPEKHSPHGRIENRPAVACSNHRFKADSLQPFCQVPVRKARGAPVVSPLPRGCYDSNTSCHVDLGTLLSLVFGEIFTIQPPREPTRATAEENSASMLCGTGLS